MVGLENDYAAIRVNTPLHHALSAAGVDGVVE